MLFKFWTKLSFSLPGFYFFIYQILLNITLWEASNNITNLIILYILNAFSDSGQSWALVYLIPTATKL